MGIPQIRPINWILLFLVFNFGYFLLIVKINYLTFLKKVNKLKLTIENLNFKKFFLI